MKKIYTLLVFTIIFLSNTSAQLFLNEEFNYPVNSALTSNSWTQISNTTPILSVNSKALVYNGYNGGGVGSSIQINATGQDVYRESSTITNSKSLYASFLLNDSIAQTAGNYFFSFGTSAGSTAFGKVFIKLSSAGYYKVGISKGTDAAVYSTDTFAINSNYLCVLKYQFNTTGNRDDSAKVFMFSNGMPLNEPSQATVDAIGGNTADANSLSKIILSQVDAASSPTVFVDAIRMSNSWENLNGTGIVNPYSVTGLTSSATGVSSINISWIKPYNFDSSTMKTLVFVKVSGTVTQGTPSISSRFYLANPNFSVASSYYQNDTAAHCVYNNTGNSVSVSGLPAGASLGILVYVVTNNDSIYSKPSVFNGVTLSLPSAVNAPTFTSTSMSSAKIAWARPGNYNRNTMTTLVYMKTGGSINVQTPLNGVGAIASDTNFSSVNSSFLPSDNNAKCMYKGDTNFVNISSLQAGVNYYFLIYVIRDADSAYSLPTLGNANLQTAVTSVSNIVFSGLSTSTARITWTKPQTYNSADMTSLVFVKALSNVNISNLPTQITSNYNADSVFALGSKYQFDSNAYSVYKGDSNHVTISNLSTATLYYVMVYIVRDSDNLYSIPVSGFGSSRQVPPNNVSNINFIGQSQTTAKIDWLKQSGYNNSTHSTLVFLKQGSILNVGVPSRAVSFYTANPNFVSAISTKYQNDSLSKCIYKGDTNFVNISGLTLNTSYHVLVYVVRDADSTYSPSQASSGFTLGAAALKNIGDLNKSNLNTGDADSLSVRATFRGVVYGFNQRRANQGGIQFLLKDATGGINVLHATKTFSYSVKEGDSVEVQGTIGSNAGLVTFTNLDTIMRIDSNRLLDNPIVFNALSEQTENKLIRIDNVKFLTIPAGNIWPAVRNNGANTVLLLKNNGADTITVRLASTNTLSGSPLPKSTYFSIIGIGSQTSTSASAPYAFNGYQIIPRVLNDVIEMQDSLSPFKLNSLPSNDTLKLTGGLTNTFKLDWNTAKSLANASNTKYTVLFGLNKKPFVIKYSVSSSNNGLDTFALINQKVFADSLLANPGDSLLIEWFVKAQTGNSISYSDTFNLFVIVDSFFTTGQSEIINNQLLDIYPNPASDAFTIQLLSNANTLANVYITDVNGKIIRDIEKVYALSNVSARAKEFLKHGMNMIKGQ